MNIHGLFLHVFGDALGSVAVIVSGLIIYLFSFPQRVYADPICSIIISLIILYTTIPLRKMMRMRSYGDSDSSEPEREWLERDRHHTEKARTGEKAMCVRAYQDLMIIFWFVHETKGQLTDLETVASGDKIAFRNDFFFLHISSTTHCRRNLSIDHPRCSDCVYILFHRVPGRPASSSLHSQLDQSRHALQRDLILGSSLCPSCNCGHLDSVNFYASIFMQKDTAGLEQ